MKKTNYTNRKGKGSSNSTSKGSSRGSKKDYRNRKPKTQIRNNTDEVFDNSTSSIMSGMTIDTPVGSNHSIMFPSDSASMQAFGNVITTPGQDNFSDAFTEVRLWNPPTDVPWIQLKPSLYAKRSSNVMTIGFTHYFGSIGNRGGQGYSTSPCALAALNLKQFIDTSFGTKTDYDPQDLMLYMMAVSAVFPMIAELKRDLRLVITAMHNQYPQFVPRGLFAALEISDGGGNYSRGEGLMYATEHLRSYVDQLNQCIITFNRLPMPPEIVMFGYNDDLFDAIYLDSEDPQTAQMYVFYNEMTWNYYEEGYDLPHLVPSHTARGSIRGRIVALQSQIERLTALRTSSTAMLQNLFNAYGSRDTVQVPTIDFNSLTPLEFVYDPHILTMVENLNAVPAGVINISDIIADPSVNDLLGSVNLVPFPDWSTAIEAGKMNYAINLPLQFHKPWDQVTPEDIGWAMRGHVAFLDESVWGNTTTPTAAALHADRYVGFMIPNEVRVYSLPETSSDPYTWYPCYRHLPTVNLSNGAVAAWTDLNRDFHSAPIMPLGVTLTDQPGPYYEIGYAYYTANRDVEVTYRLEDMRMFWTYMTLTVWAATVDRNVIGTRRTGSK